jgi:hypothetical protein
MPGRSVPAGEERPDYPEPFPIRGLEPRAYAPARAGLGAKGTGIMCLFSCLSR